MCYNDANCVNVYTETGEFLWCVSTPYLRNSYFILQDDKLIICDGDAYIYNVETTGAYDVRRSIFNLCAQNNWAIVGLAPIGTDLESVFIRLVDRSDNEGKATSGKRAR